MFGHLVNAFLGEFFAFGALVVKGGGYNAYGEDTHFAGHFSDDRGGAGAGAFAHSGGDEEHLGLFSYEVGDFLLAFHGQLSGNFRSCAGAQARAKQEFAGNRALLQMPLVGVANQEVNTFDTFFVHVSHSVASAATNA